MEITICKKMWLEIEVDVPDDVTEEVLREKVEEIIEDYVYPEEWSSDDYRGKEIYEVYDNYTGCDLFTIER